jgi:hypothetical protein
MFLHLYESKVRFFRKHRGRLAAVIYKGILAAAALPRLLAPPLGRIRGAGRPSEDGLVSDHYRMLLRALPGF